LDKIGNIAVKHCFFSLFPSISSLARHFPKQNLSLGSSIVFSLDLKAVPCFQEAKFAPPTPEAFHFFAGFTLNENRRGAKLGREG